ncbi:MAG: hypothetical protein AAGC93_17360 [Cyanobacteria bacterium P01_F01_bin.53]
MATKAKDKLTAEKSPAAKAKGKAAETAAEAAPAAVKAKGKTKGKAAAKATASAAKKTKGKATTKATASQKAQTRKAKNDAIAVEEAPKKTPKAAMPPELEFLVSPGPSPATAPEPSATESSATNSSATESSGAEPSDLVAHSSGSNGNGANSDVMTFIAADCLNGDIWVPNAAIPELDQATYELQKAQAEGQRRAIEVASLNLKNINGLHQLEGHSLDVAISAKTNETQEAQLAGAEIDYQRQLELNGEKSQQLQQAIAKHEAATRETGYTDELISLKDQNFELEIQQAQNVFAEKAARYRAQLTGQ